MGLTRERLMDLLKLLAVGLAIVALGFGILMWAIYREEMREGHTQQLEAAIRNAALAEEEYLPSKGVYTTSLSDLEREGLKYPETVRFRIVVDGSKGYCIEGRHEELGDTVLHYVSTSGDYFGLPEGRCPN